MPTPLRSLADRYPRLRRLSVLIIVAGGLAAWAFVKPHLPHDHPIAWRFDPDGASVTALEAVWTRPGSEEPVAGSKFNFQTGTAPRDLLTTVRAPDGDYVVEYTVFLTSGRVQDQQRLTLGEHVSHVRVLLPAPASSKE